MIDHFNRLIIESKLNVNVFFDVGANIGSFTEAIKAQYPNCQCHAFEPVRPIFRVLKKNLRDYSNTVVNRILVSEENKRWDHIFIDPLLKSEIIGTCTKYEMDPLRGQGDISRWRRQRVRSTTLSDYIKVNAISKVDLIKIDVEGYEFAVIKGLLDFLKNSDHKPFLYVEVGWGTNHPEWKTKCLPVYEELFQIGYQRVNFSDVTEDMFFEPDMVSKN